ncbi:MAG: tyrosine-type recombinase/integrase [Anaerolineae bacterium]
MNLHEAVDLFISRPDIKPATSRSYRYDLHAMSEFIGPSKPLSSVIPADVMRYFVHLNQSDSIQSDHTYNKHVTSARAFFKFCVDMQLLDASPAKTIKKKKVSYAVDLSKAMPDHKLRRLLEYVSESPRGWHPREEALVRFIADTGSRIGGARSLTWSQVDLSNRTAITYEKGKLEPHAKSFGRECARALGAWKLKQDAVSGQYVFSTDGRMMSDGNLAQYFRRLCQRAGIGSWGPHSLRHRFGHRAIEQFPVSVVAAMLGDTVEVTIASYLPKDKAAVEQAMRQMTTDQILTHNASDVMRFIRAE